MQSAILLLLFIPLCIVQRLPMLAHLWLQWFCSKLAEKQAGSLADTKVQRILKVSDSRIYSLLEEKEYEWDGPSAC